MSPRDTSRRETANERADRNLSELLQELRVVLPGIQVLFAFLLTVPFAQRFGSLTRYQVDLFFVILLLTALATVLLIAPTANHRLLFRKRQKEHLVQVSNRLAIAGLAVLAVAMCGAILLISDMLFGPGHTKTLATVGTAALFIVFWALMPLIRRARLR